MPPRPGLAATVSLVVTDDDTASALRTGDVAVLATPRVIALAEEASVQAVTRALDPGITTVGYRVQLDHLAPTVPGSTIEAQATLETVEGRRLTFRVSITDSHGLVAAGRITRVSVERERFMDKARAPSP
jgi:fluoroacetyl-CoA thioesterase